MKMNYLSRDIQLWIINSGMKFVILCILILSFTKKITMKKIMMCLVFFIGVGLAANAQTTTNKEKAPKEKMATKEHVCTDACAKAGKCVLKDGEKCTKACCKKAMKEHVCTDACAKAGKCVMKDGEKCTKACCSKDKKAMKEHVCTDACKKAGKCVMKDGETCTKACCSKNSKGMKAHVCTDACHKEGKCVMAHGEKGHVCSKDCKKA